MARLAVIIVNYNVKYFLEQCLRSVYRAGEGIDMEVWVIDNASDDGSQEMIRRKFPELKLIANEENVGFSRANNQAMQASEAEYMLLLNPDTVVEEDTFRKCIEYMDTRPDAGGLGVKMVDGKGTFLPESKRGLPSPMVSFYKLSGLASLFPESPRFARYYLGHLDKDENHEVEILSGAFMFMRKEALDNSGLLDEDFFMYGEDIDLSYRLIKAGYKNHYLADTTIIHYKGESTRRGSLNYVRIFYKAMDLFAAKHFKTAAVYRFAIRLAIVFSALFSLLRNLFSRGSHLLIDAGLSFAGLYLLQHLWATMVKKEVSSYPYEFVFIVVPLYVLTWMVSVYFSGGYDRPLKISRLLRGMFFGTLFIAAIYGLLPNDLRFSRAIILLGAVWTTGAMGFSRILFNFIRHRHFSLEEDLEQRVIIVGDGAEAQRALALLKQTNARSVFAGIVSPDDADAENESVIGHTSELSELVRLYDVEELIFCSKSVTASQIIDWMTGIGPQLDYKIVPEESGSIIGSNSKNTAGDLYAIDINLQLGTAEARRNKRFFDMAICLLFLPLLPLMLIFVPQRRQFLFNWYSVLSGQRTWVSYDLAALGELVRLPSIHRGILSPSDGVDAESISPEVRSRLNYLYAKDYSVYSDLRIMLRNISRLGRLAE